MKEGPRDHRVARGIAHRGTAEIDYRAQAATRDEQVADRDVPMDPYRRSIPVRRERRLPNLKHQHGIVLVTQHLDRAPRRFVVDGERPATVETVFARDWPTGCVNLVERC